jgi:tRNA(Ile)-lysidine synthase TilS/MesJ
MHTDVERYARNLLKERLALLEDKHHDIFRRMYSHKDLSKPVDRVVDDMEAGQLDWALSQVDNTLRKAGLL